MRDAGLILVGVVLLSARTAGDGCGERLPANAAVGQAAQGPGAGANVESTATLRTLRILPWVEVNYPKYDEVAIDGLTLWRGVASAAIVSTSPGRADLYPRLRERVPGLRVIPGLKTMALLPRFDSVEGWGRVSAEVAAFCKAAEESVVLLENEVAMKAYVDGTEVLDADKLRAGLSLLPQGLRYLWYPSVFGTPAQQERNAVVCEIVQAVFKENVRFLDQRYQGREAVRAPSRMAADRRLKGIATQATLPMVYFYGPAHPRVWWRDEELGDALGHIQQGWGEGADVVIYPGVKRWKEASAVLTERLRRLGIEPATPERPDRRSVP